jgi:hypothetical protein
MKKGEMRGKWFVDVLITFRADFIKKKRHKTRMYTFQSSGKGIKMKRTLTPPFLRAPKDSPKIGVLSNHGTILAPKSITAERGAYV